jgi:hypothetical protein
MTKFQLILNQKAPPLPAYQIGKQGISAGAPKFTEVQAQTEDEAKAKAISWMGTPIRDRLILESDDLTVILDNVIMTLSMTKNIVKTIINGRKGTVKEWVSDGDYNITVSGGLYGHTSAYPEEQVFALRRVLESGQALNCQSDFLDLFGVYQIVIETFNIPQSEGFTNVQPFDFTASSDEPIELLINV